MSSLKLTLIAFSFLILSSCTGNSTPSPEVTPPTSSVVDKPLSTTESNTTNTSSITPTPSTGSSWNTSSWSTVVTPLSSSIDNLSSDTKKILELQKEKWPNALLELNCSKYDTEWKKFCTSQQTLIKKFNEETITWEETLKKWPDYIKTFDCMKIANEFWQKYCKEYQVALAVSNNIKK